MRNETITPRIISGEVFKDTRGTVFHNNSFDLKSIRRSYIIDNINVSFLRGWKGHLIESRWFICVRGSILIYVISIENLTNLQEIYQVYKFDDSKMNVLYIPPGYATLIKQSSPNSRVMAFSDWLIGESNDEDLRWPNNVFKL